MSRANQGLNLFQYLSCALLRCNASRLCDLLSLFVLALEASRAKAISEDKHHERQACYFYRAKLSAPRSLQMRCSNTQLYKTKRNSSNNGREQKKKQKQKLSQLPFEI